MAILGYDTMGTAFTGMGTGRMRVSRHTLAAPATMTEMHGWFNDGGGASNVRLVIYKHVSGTSPDTATLVAYSNSLALTGGASVHLQQTGFSVALTAADYWIGWKSDVSGGLGRGTTLGGDQFFGANGVTDPPPSPFGFAGSSGTEKQSCWVVVGSAAAAFIPQIIVS